MDQYFGGSGDTTGDRFDGADSFESYSAEPTAYSGLVNGKNKYKITRTKTKL